MSKTKNSCLQSESSCGNIINIEGFKKLCKKYQKLSQNIDEEYESNIISFDEVLERKERMNKSLTKAVLEIHTSPITQGKGKDTRWFTPIKKGGKRVILKKPTYDEIIAELIDFYGIGKDIPTLRNLYPEWLKYKLALGATTSYITRLNADWEKYYINDPIVDKDIRTLNTIIIRKWLATYITAYKLSSKNFYNMQTIFKQIFGYYKELNKQTFENPFDEISFPKRQYFKDEEGKNGKRTQAKKQVFSKEDIKKIKVIAMQEYLNNPSYTTSTASLGILLLFQTGLRVGELVALRNCDIHEDYLSVAGEEQRDYEIVFNDETKTVKCVYLGTKVGAAKTPAAYRNIPLTSEAKRLINLIRKTNSDNGYKTEDYLFVNANQRLQENTILKHIYKYCDRAFIDRRSPHKIRKTFASLLYNDGVMDLSEISELMGHEDERTLIKHYLYSTQENSTRVSRMQQALAI